MKLLTIAFRNIRRNTKRSILSGIAIGVAVMAIVFLFSLLAGMKRDMESNITRFMSGHIRIRHSEYDENEHLNPLHLVVDNYQEIVSGLEEVENVDMVAPRILFPTAIYHNDMTFKGMGLVVDFEIEKFFQNLEQSLKKGRIPLADERGMLISSGLADELGVTLEDKITILTKTRFRGNNAITFKITGIIHFPVASFNKKYFLISLESGRSLLKMGDSVTEILVLLKNPARLAATTQAVKSLITGIERQKLSVKSWKEISFVYSLFELADISYYIIALFFFLLGTTVIANTTMMVIYERMREIGTVSALGMTGSQIIVLFFLEAFLISVIASFIGALLGVGITIPLSVYGIDYGKALEGVEYEISNIVRPMVDMGSAVFVFFYAVAVASLISFLPSRRAARIEPVTALRAV
jgi:putative ABC transport system permease protein